MRDLESSTQFDLSAFFNCKDRRSWELQGLNLSLSSVLIALYWVMFPSSGWLPSLFSLDYILEASIKIKRNNVRKTHICVDSVSCLVSPITPILLTKVLISV